MREEISDFGFGNSDLLSWELQNRSEVTARQRVVAQGSIGGEVGPQISADELRSGLQEGLD
jgi:hypothetical protein